jgi:hypothetical protein
LRYGDEDGDFTEDLTDEPTGDPAQPDAPAPGAAPADPGPARGRRRPPLVAILVGALFIALLGAAFAFEQTSRFLQARAVDDAAVVGYLADENQAIDTDRADGVTLNGDFFLTTSAGMPLTLERIDLGYGPMDVGGKVVLSGDKLTKVRLQVQTTCGSPTSAPAADVLSPDGRRFRLPVAGPPEQVSEAAGKFWCDGGDASNSFGGFTSSYIDPGPVDAVGIRVVEMSAHGRAFRVVVAGGAQAPATTVSLLPRNSPRDPRARATWKITVDPPGVLNVTAGNRVTAVVELSYGRCRQGDPTPALDPVRVLAVPVQAPDSPRDTIAGWREEVVTEAAQNALDADCVP